MPIRAEWRKIFYGREWRAYRRALIAVRGAVCRDCGRAIARYVNLCHETHDPRTSSVKIVCPGCHSRRDSRHRLAVIRRRRAEACGQLWLLPEIEWAAAPAWEIPAEVFRSAQGRLFG